jgi:hypothetical protein
MVAMGQICEQHQLSAVKRRDVLRVDSLGDIKAGINFILRSLCCLMN